MDVLDCVVGVSTVPLNCTTVPAMMFWPVIVIVKEGAPVVVLDGLRALMLAGGGVVTGNGNACEVAARGAGLDTVRLREATAASRLDGKVARSVVLLTKVVASCVEPADTTDPDT